MKLPLHPEARESSDDELPVTDFTAAFEDRRLHAFHQSDEASVGRPKRNSAGRAAVKSGTGGSSSLAKRGALTLGKVGVTRSFVPDDFDAQVDSLLKQSFPEEKLSSLVKLAGEASYREYFRVSTAGGASFVLMKMPAGASSASEEISRTTQKPTELPFIDVQRYLKSLDLPVPEIIAFSADRRLILLEDLGDQTLEKVLAPCGGEMRLFFYRLAIGLLLRLQKETARRVDSDCIAFGRIYDRDLLVWELEHFLEYGIEDRFGLKVPADEKENFRETAEKIAREICKIPTGFVHRDFQSRNLMLHHYELRLIDFQDALKGPILYDLVALLRDSYIELSDEELVTQQKEYATRLAPSNLYPDLARLTRDFDLLTVQRKLKDAGRFQYIKTVKGNPNFLKHVPLSLKYVRRALDSLPGLEDLRHFLAKYLEEFG